MRLGIIAALVLWCGFCAAEEIDLEAVRETLDKAVDTYFEEIIELDKEITERIDKLIEMAGNRGDLDDVEELQRQREAYLRTGFMPEGRIHLVTRRKAEFGINRAKSRLDQAYEVAIENLTKEGRYTDARRIKNERLSLEQKLTAAQPELQPTNIINQARERLDPIQKQTKEQVVSSGMKAITNDIPVNKQNVVNTIKDSGEIYTNSIGMKLRAIPPGQFLMQGTTKATITKPFYIGVYEVTQKEWKAVMGSLPENTNGEGDDLPVTGVSWNAATEFCQKLSNMPDEESDGCVYRLPTGAEWEYSCRAGTNTDYFFGDDASKLGDYAWFKENFEGQVHPVGTKQPNPAGLYDMHGNVWEWSRDKNSSDLPILRGGSVIDVSSDCRCIHGIGRGVAAEEWNCGLRVVMTRHVPKASEAIDDFKLKSELGPAYTNSIGMKLRAIPPGQFLMDGTTKATITKPFYIGVYEVTQKEWKAVMGSLPENTKTEGDDMPAQGVSWNAANEFCQKLSNMPDEKASGCVYRLPTDTEWEYACRAGTNTEYHFGDDPALMDKYAWIKRNSNHASHSVGTKKPNAAGLYDMYGNVYEWCSDWLYDLPSEVTDYVGPTKKPYGTESRKVCRGGFYNMEASPSVTHRNGGWPQVRMIDGYSNGDEDYRGLRVVMTKN